MKKLFLLFAIALASCETKNATINSTEVVINGYEIRNYEIDGCEYIGWLNGNSSVLTHKGNCKFCTERNKK